LQILVRYRGALPDLFREGHSVVAEGFVKPMSQYPGIPPNSPDMHTSLTEKAKESGCYFAAIEVLAKHDEVVVSYFGSYESMFLTCVVICLLCLCCVCTAQNMSIIVWF
jgi:cytochrome c-type biogenesis protein CcmE